MKTTPVRELTLTGQTTSDQLSILKAQWLSSDWRSIHNCPGTGTGISTGVRLEPLVRAAARIIMAPNLSLRWAGSKYLWQLFYFLCRLKVEARNVRDWVAARKDRIVFYQTLHGYSQFILIPWYCKVSLCDITLSFGLHFSLCIFSSKEWFLQNMFALQSKSSCTWQGCTPLEVLSTWIVQKPFLVFRGHTDTPAPGYDAMYDLAVRGNDALYAVHEEYYEVWNYCHFSFFNVDIFQCQVGCIPCLLYTASGTSLDWALGVAQIPYVYRCFITCFLHALCFYPVPYVYRWIFTFDEVHHSHNWTFLITNQCLWMNHIALHVFFPLGVFILCQNEQFQALRMFSRTLQETDNLYFQHWAERHRPLWVHPAPRADHTHCRRGLGVPQGEGLVEIEY